MSGQKRPSTGLRDHKNPKPCIRAIFNNCFCAIEQPCLSWKRIRHGSTAASGSTARVQKQQHQEHRSLSMSMSRACKPTPLKVSRAEMMQEQKRRTHTLHFSICACTHPRMRAHVHARTPARAHIHARKPVCTDAHANTHVRAYVRKGTCTRTRLHTRRTQYGCIASNQLFIWLPCKKPGNLAIPKKFEPHKTLFIKPVFWLQ